VCYVLADVEIKRIAKSETSSLSSPSSDQSEDGDDSESMSEDILSRPSHCLDISDKTQLSESSTRAVSQFVLVR
jgi:hypothetical protein